MISATISGQSIKQALRDISKVHRKKSLKFNRTLGKKISRRFRAAAKAGKKDIASPVAKQTGLTVTQARKRVRSSKKISSSKFHSEIFVRGRAQRVHAGVLKSLRANKGGIKVRGKFIKGGFILPGTFLGPKQKRRVLVNTGGKVTALTDKTQIPRVFRRAGPRVLRKQTRRLLAEVGNLVKKA